MLSMFQVEKLLETITKGPKSPPRKFQRSPKIVGYERIDEYQEPSLELKEPLLSSSQEDIDNDFDQQIKKEFKGVNTKGNTNTNNNNNSVRVKVLLTKEEAAKLLAKCKEEGALDFKDVVNQLVKLPPQRINVVSSVPNNVSSKDLELSTILEDDEENNDQYYNKNK